MQIITLINPDEYLEQETKGETKSEYHAGEIRNRAGAQLSHNRIVQSRLLFESVS